MVLINQERILTLRASRGDGSKELRKASPKTKKQLSSAKIPSFKKMDSNPQHASSAGEF